MRSERGRPADFERARELDARRPDLRMGLVDASVIALCERLGAGSIATLDRGALRRRRDRGPTADLPSLAAPFRGPAFDNKPKA